MLAFLLALLMVTAAKAESLNNLPSLEPEQYAPGMEIPRDKLPKLPPRATPRPTSPRQGNLNSRHRLLPYRFVRSLP